MVSWRDYNPNLDTNLDDWILESYSKNAILVNNFALFNVCFSDMYVWYQDHPNEMSNIKDIIKVASIDNEVVSVVIINYYVDVEGKLILGINPMVANPKYIGQGYGSVVLGDLIQNVSKIIGDKVDCLKAGIEDINMRSLKLFKKHGFNKAHGQTKDGITEYELWL